MTQLDNTRQSRRGRLFPEYTIPPEELARRQAEREQRYQQCRAVFERILPEMLKHHYNWFVVIEPNSGEYFIDFNQEIAIQKARQQHPTGRLGVFRLNETGACGRI